MFMHHYRMLRSITDSFRNVQCESEPSTTATKAASTTTATSSSTKTEAIEGPHSENNVDDLIRNMQHLFPTTAADNQQPESNRWKNNENQGTPIRTKDDQASK